MTMYGDVRIYAYILHRRRRCSTFIMLSPDFDGSSRRLGNINDPNSGASLRSVGWCILRSFQLAPDVRFYEIIFRQNTVRPLLT